MLGVILGAGDTKVPMTKLPALTKFAYEAIENYDYKFKRNMTTTQCIGISIKI